MGVGRRWRLAATSPRTPGVATLLSMRSRLAPTQRFTITWAASRISARDGCASLAKLMCGFVRIICAFCGSFASQRASHQTAWIQKACPRQFVRAMNSRNSRVRAEVVKLLAAPHAGDIKRTMSESGFLEPILDGIGYPRRLRHLIAIEAEYLLNGDIILRLAAPVVALPAAR